MINQNKIILSEIKRQQKASFLVRGPLCCLQVKGCAYLLGENTARRLSRVLKILIFQSVTSPFKCAIISKYFIYPEKIIFQINAENAIVKSAVVFKIRLYDFFLPKCTG